jgi:hypothetical protein
MTDPAITALMELYALKYKESRPHYMFVPEPIAGNIEEMYKKMRKLSIMKYVSTNEHAQLPKLLKELGERARERRREIAAHVVL